MKNLLIALTLLGSVSVFANGNSCEMKLTQKIMSLESRILNSNLSLESDESITLNAALAGVDTLHVQGQSTCENKLEVVDRIENTFLKLIK